MRYAAAVAVCAAHAAAAQVPSIDYQGLTLRSGQIVVADGFDALSVLLTLSMREFSTYTHSGVLAIEDGRPVVYESIGKVMFWREDPPSDATVGRIGRSPLERFLRRQAHVEIYDPPPGVDPAAVAAFARRSFERKVPFDAYFSRARDSYYCTELVAYAIEAGGGRVALNGARDNASLRVLRRWLSQNDDRVYAADALVENGHYRGTITSFPSRTTYLAYREAKREIHRRFTAEQRLGSVFFLDGHKLKLREPVVRFVERAMQAFPRNEASATPQTMQERIEALAGEVLGPWPGGGGAVSAQALTSQR